MSSRLVALERPPHPLPNEVRFNYELVDRVPLTHAGAYRHVERWKVTIAIDSADDHDGDLTIGDAQVIILNLEAGRDVRDFADTGTGQWREIDVDNQPPAGTDGSGAAPSHVLVLERVWVTPEYRGNGLGPVIATAVIDRLGRGCRFAACYPAPFEGPLRPQDREHEIDALGRIWAKVGFRPWRDGVWMLDLEPEALSRRVG